MLVVNLNLIISSFKNSQVFEYLINVFILLVDNKHVLIIILDNYY